jgi:hypothetical protein
VGDVDQWECCVFAQQVCGCAAKSVRKLIGFALHR